MKIYQYYNSALDDTVRVTAHSVVVTDGGSLIFYLDYAHTTIVAAAPVGTWTHLRIAE